MLKVVLLILSLNVASILAVVTTLYHTPRAYIEWEIQSVSDLPKGIDYCLNSSTFSFANRKCHLSMFPNGETNYPADTTVSAYLSCEDFGERYQAIVSMGLINKDGKENIHRYAEHTFNEVYSYWRWYKGTYRSSLYYYATGDILTIFCKAEIANRTEVTPQITSSSPGLHSLQSVSICNQSNLSRTSCNTTQGTETLSGNLMDLYASKRFTDVTIICKNVEFTAHKIILSYRLPAFGSMLEKNPNKIEIPDCDPESFEEFLRFIYTGKLIDMSSKKTMSLYLTANKFNMYELKEECARYIAEHILNIDSFYDILRFANLQSDSMLLMSTTEFFITNAKLILPSEKWKQFLADEPLKGNELFLAYVEKKN